jgi:predicted nucleic acid-binding protein
VIDEISVGLDGTILSSELRNIATVKIVPQVNVPPAIAQWELGNGESQVLAAALETPGSAVIIDDLAARKCAKTLGCAMIGTVGVIVCVGYHHHPVTQATRW